MEVALARKTADLERTTYILSHDLRKPLRHIVGFAEAFLEDYGTLEGLDDQGRQYIEEMVGGAKRMERLLDGILQFARLGELDESTIVNLYSGWKDVIDDNRSDLDEIGGHAHVRGHLPKVLGSPRLLYQLLGNLVGNAVKFRSKERPLKISLHAHTRGNKVVVCLEDNGVGIPAYLRKEAFDLFRRVGPQAQSTEGMGLGLAVCRRIVEAHGGKIHADASPLGGTVIKFSLPAVYG